MKNNKNNNVKKNKFNKVAFLLNLLFSILIIFFLAIIIKEKETSIIPIECGVILLMILFNISRMVKVNNTNRKKLLIITFIANIISFLLALVFKNYIIFSYALTIPAFTLSLKCIKVKKDKLSIFSQIISSIMLIICIVISVFGFIYAN